MYGVWIHNTEKKCILQSLWYRPWPLSIMKLDNFVGFFAFFELFFRFFPLLSKLYWTVVCTLLCMQTTKYIILWTKWQSCQGNFLLQCKKEEIEGGLSNVHFSDERKRVFWWNITSSLMIQITQKCISASWN